jgi:hypothetical protein
MPAAVREKRFAWIISICEINASRRPAFNETLRY